MVKKDFGKTGLKVFPLGFGAMRLPMVDIGGEQFTDLDQAADVIRHAYESGINYFDSGLLYCAGESEFALSKGLKGIRDKVILTTKATKFHVKKKGDLRRMLEHQLSRLDTGYLDFYCFHGIGWDVFWETDKTTNWIKDMEKAHDEGLVKHIAFSFHDAPENMIKLIDTGMFEMVTCQYNYLDRRNEKAIAYAHEKGLAVVVMGPLGGGRLVGMPGFIADNNTLRDFNPRELALRFVASNPAVSIPLSGMGSREMVDENIAAVSKGALNDDEHTQLETLLKKTKKMADLYCTGCGYCMPCPHGVNIAGRFAAMNLLKVYGLKEQALTSYLNVLKAEKNQPGHGKCVKCGKCEKRCPQKIKIIKQLKETKKAFKKLAEEK